MKTFKCILLALALIPGVALATECECGDKQCKSECTENNCEKAETKCDCEGDCHGKKHKEEVKGRFNAKKDNKVNNFLSQKAPLSRANPDNN